MSTWNCPKCNSISSDLRYTKTNAGHSKTRICMACNAECYFESLPDGSFYATYKHEKTEKNLAKSLFGALGVVGIFIGFSISSFFWTLIGCVSIFFWIHYPTRNK